MLRAPRRSRCALPACWLAVLALASSAPTQSWQDLAGRSRSGIVELRQAVLDANSDTLVLLVASHPDDRYLLPAVDLRFVRGARVAVLLASRGGGAQNSLGPETGDALERIRTLEAEAGCMQMDAPVYYLDRPDRGFRRTAAETFGEWGRAETRDRIVHVVREIRPDFVVTTHNAEETHGHDLAVVELLPEALAAAGDEKVQNGAPPHRVRGLFLGAATTSLRPAVVVHGDQFEPNRGAALRRIAHDVLARCHVSPGWPGSMESVFAAETGFDPVPLPWPTLPDWTNGVPSLLDASIWPGTDPEAKAIRERLSALREAGDDRQRLLDTAVECLRMLQGVACPAGSEAALRRERRIDALRRVVLHANAVAIEVEAPAAAVAVPGEQLTLDARIHVGGPRALESVRLVEQGNVASLEPIDSDQPRAAAGSMLHAAINYRVPLGERGRVDPTEALFHAPRFVPPVRLHFQLAICGIEVPVVLDAPQELRPAVELVPWPRMLLCPTHRDEVRFSVEVVRNSMFPVIGRVDVRAPAGYRVQGERTAVLLQTERGDTFDFTLQPPADRKSGVDVIRIGLGDSRVVLPMHKVDVHIDPRLRIGLVRNRDDALVSVIGVGGFGLRWSELSDVDLAVRDLGEFDTIVVEARALRDRPAARRSFRRLLDFCGSRGKRLVVFYHKDVEFDPPGEGFLGAPFLPFAIGKDRVTHADAPVTILSKDHCLLQKPNRILPGDWDGWEQERGLYFPARYGSEYQEILEIQDPGLPAKRSALLYTRAGPGGEGEYVYCALSLWRQLKKLHPGSVRLLANLLSPQPRPQ